MPGAVPQCWKWQCREPSGEAHLIPGKCRGNWALQFPPVRWPHGLSTEQLPGNSLPPAPPVQAGVAPSTSHCSQCPQAALPAPPANPAPAPSPLPAAAGKTPLRGALAGRGERCAQELRMLEGDPLPRLFRGTRIYQYLLQTKISLLVFGFLGETRTAVSLLSRCVKHMA